MDVHQAVRISQKLQKTPRGHHVQSLVVVVVVAVERLRRKLQKVAVEEEDVDVDVDVVSPPVGLRRALLVFLWMKRWRGE